jgi:hypothetical protein
MIRTKAQSGSCYCKGRPHGVDNLSSQFQVAVQQRTKTTKAYRRRKSSRSCLRICIHKKGVVPRITTNERTARGSTVIHTHVKHQPKPRHIANPPLSKKKKGQPFPPTGSIPGAAPGTRSSDMSSARRLRGCACRLRAQPHALQHSNTRG